MLKRRNSKKEKVKEEKPKKKKGGSGKRKGGNFEREICKQLSLWYSKGKADDLFWRTAGSGARATIRSKKGKCTTNSAGDVCALDTKAQPFIDLCLIELKRGYSGKQKVSLGDIIDRLLNKKTLSNSPLLLKWVEKAKHEAKQNNIKHPIIIFKKDRKRACIVLMKHTWEEIKENNSNNWVFPHDGPLATIHYNDHCFIVTALDDFLSWCDPKAFLKKLKKIKRRVYKKGKYSGNKIKNLK